MIKTINRFISVILVIAILLPIGGEAISSCSIRAYADSDEIELDEETKEALEDYKSLLSYKAGNWGNAIGDHVVPPWNIFHNAVQNDIRAKQQGIVEPNELSLTKPNGKNGRADLWKRNKDNTADIWEVKPGSYINPIKYSKAISQLYTYTQSTPLKSKISKLNIGDQLLLVTQK